MGKKRVTIIFLLALTAFALYLCYRLFQPFLNPMISALVIRPWLHCDICASIESRLIAALSRALPTPMEIRSWCRRF